MSSLSIPILRRARWAVLAFSLLPASSAMPRSSPRQQESPAAAAELHAGAEWRPERGPAAWLTAPGVVWSTALGTRRTDWINRVVQLRDGAILSVGFVNRDDADAAQDWDVIVLEHSPAGELVRARRHGGAGLDAAWSVVEDPDGRLVLSGFSSSASRDAGDWDAYLLALRRDGQVLAQRQYGGPAGDRAPGLVRAPDGGYLLVGETRSQGAGERDVFLVKVDARGEEQWRRTHGGPRMERAFAGIPAAGGGFVVIGTCGVESDVDGLVLRVDSEGREVWRRTLEGDQDVVPHHVDALPGGRILVTGYTNSFGADSNDVLAVTLAPGGEILRHELLGGAGDDRAMTSAVASDGSAWIVGSTQSTGQGGWDVLLARVSSAGELEPRCLALGTAREEQGTSVLPLADGELILAGYAAPEGALPDLFLLRLDPARATWQSDCVAVTRIE